MSTAERTPAETLRHCVVLIVLIGIQLLAFGLYTLIGYLCITKGADAVPDALWLAAGTYGGAQVTWLVNSKGGTDTAPAGTPADPVNVKTAEQPLEVTAASSGKHAAPEVGEELPVVDLTAA
jgi:hypothetical protein